MSTSTRKPRTTRRLTISRQYYDIRQDGRWTGSRTVPFLRLSGDWLEQAGFRIDQKVSIKVTNRRITIVPEP